MTRHTPGPWALADDAGSAFCYEVRATATDGRPMGIALVYGNGDHYAATAEDTANARLLAAAPDLLAALRSIADIPKQDEPEEPGSEYRQDWHDHDGGDRAIKALHDAIDRARAAIELAGGAL